MPRTRPTPMWTAARWAPGAWSERSRSSPTRCSRAARASCSPPTTTRSSRSPARCAARASRAAHGTATAASPATTTPSAWASTTASTSCAMPVIVDDEARRDPVRRYLRERHGVQTSLLYPAVHEFTAYRERFGVPLLPRAEHIARSEITIPLFPEMDEATQDRVVAALAEALA